MAKVTINLKKPLLEDNVFVSTQVVSLSGITGMDTRRGLEKAVLSEGQIVNVVSNIYGHLTNQDFFGKVEQKLIDADIDYSVRSINRENRSFAVDYILNDERYIVTVKNDADRIRPMLRFTNSYDGSGKTSGHFGFFREVCSNGLHVAHSKVGFAVKHTGNIAAVVLPEISELVKKFMDNEFYEIRRKFEVLAERPIEDVREFVRLTAENMNVFKYESSEKNPEPGLNARLVIDGINREARMFGEKPTFWHGYNAFNEVLHDKLKKSFDVQRVTDTKIFENLLEFA